MSPRTPQWQRPAVVNVTFTGDSAGQVEPGTAVRTATAEKGTISALFTADPETDTITIAFGWQVSDDDSTYYNCADLTNTAPTVMGTGTGGADVTASKVSGPPDWAYGWKYVRPVLISGVTTGAAADVGTITTYYVAANSAFE